MGKVCYPTQKERREFAEVQSDELIELDIDFDTFCPFAYIDSTHLKTTHPGAGPIEKGECARRRNSAFEIQRAFCNTYIKVNELKFQIIMLPNGMCDPYMDHRYITMILVC